MQLHELKPEHKRKSSRRKRGGKKGKYCGRGIKGQKTRSGKNMMPSIRQLIKKYHKLRGYRFKPKEGKPAIVNIGKLEKNFKKGEVVSPKTLIEKRIVRRKKGRVPSVKILGNGTLTKALKIKDCFLSKSAEEKIKKTGGSIE